MEKEQRAIRHLYLDLEDTVITPQLEGWLAVDVINIPQVKQFIQTWAPDYVHIFSFAIYHSEDLEGFNRSLRARLERVLGVEFSSVPRLDFEIKEACCNETWIHESHVTRQEIIDFFGKQGSFRHFVKQKFQHTQVPIEVAFLDDMVFTEKFDWPTLGIKGLIQNVTEL